MKIYRTISILAAIVTCCASDSPGQEQWIFSAMKDEMKRSSEQLKIEPLQAPYYLSYKVSDSRSFTVRTSLGSLLSVSDNPHSRSLNIQLRVGSRTFDNSNFVSYGAYSGSGVVYVSDDGTKSTANEGDYLTLRRDLWLASDALYKRALGEYSKKKAVLENIIRSDSTPDFSAVKPCVRLTNPPQAAIDREFWQNRAKIVSQVFRKYPEIQYSAVNVGVLTDCTYFLNNEGSQNTRSKMRAWVEVKAKTQAPDGMPLINFISFYGESAALLPSEKEMTAQVAKMADELIALRNAPLLDEYSGPAIFEGQAAAELISQGLGTNVSHLREPVADNPQLRQTIRTQVGELPLQNKIGARIFPKDISVTDEPLQKVYNGIPLAAAFDIDEEGVPAQNVKVVDKGFLKTLLTSRAPHKRIPESNGHARTDPSQAFFSNLIVSTSRPTKDAEMKKKLIALCKEVGLEYGLIIRKITNPSVKESMLDAGEPMPGRTFLTEPILVYKVFPDGKEQLVRGLEFSNMSTHSFKDIVAASQSEFIYNHNAKQRRTVLSGLYNSTDIKVSVVTPSFVFESVDLKKTSQVSRNLPIVARPEMQK